MKFKGNKHYYFFCHRGQRSLGVELETPLALLAKKEATEYLKATLDRLPPDMATVVKRLYGIGCQAERANRLARRLNRSGAWVSRTAHSALVRLARDLRPITS